METLQITWNLFSLFSIFAVPQLLGALIYFRLRSFRKLLAHIAGFLGSTTSFFYLSGLFWVYLPAKSHPHDCGLPMLGALFMVLIGTGITVFLSLTVQLILRQRTRTLDTFTL